MRVGKIITVLFLIGSVACSSSSSKDKSKKGNVPEVVQHSDYWVFYRGPEGNVEVNYRLAERSLGNELLLLELAITGGNRTIDVTLDDIRVRTPQGYTIPPLTNTEFRSVYGSIRLTLQKPDAWAGPSQKFTGVRRPCGRWFVVPPGERAPGSTNLRISPSDICFGPLAFQVPAGVQPGQWLLTVDLEEGQARVPFALGKTENPG